MKKELKIFDIISEIYIGIMIILFPLIINKTGYYHIFDCKWNTYLIIGIIYLLIILLTYLYFLIFKKQNVLKNKKLNIVQWLAIIFLIINIISCFLSPYFSKYNLFVGVGRGEGLIMTSLYILTFLVITMFSTFKKRYLLYFSISGILVSLIGVFQLLGFNPFNLYQGNLGIHNISFLTTIGNIDFVSKLFVIYIILSFTCFIFLNNTKKEKIIYLTSFILECIIFTNINVNSGLLAFIVCLMIIAPLLISNNKRLSKFLITIVGLTFVFLISEIINPVYHSAINKITLDFRFNFVSLIFIIIIIGLVFLAYKFNNIHYDFSKNKKIITNLYLLILSCIIIGILGLYFYNFQSGFLYEVHSMLHGVFKDEFGTYRIFLWKRSLNIFTNYPIIGTGPDTFAIRFMARFTEDVKAIGPLTLNDTAANVYLTMLVNTGIYGLLSYLLFIFSLIKKSIKKINPYTFVLLITIVGYLIQDFFNISLVIVTPIFWILLAICLNSKEDQLTK